MSRVQIGKIYSRADEKLVYHKHVVPLKVGHDGMVEALNVETGEPAFFNYAILEDFYKMESKWVI